mmetsp:Transcript_9519/g.39151  ORF Transcript_9519/g.39151 Transcript_9519/m.39151 type:complete len:227 (-) Transcript_9519:4145-4825(-)
MAVTILLRSVRSVHVLLASACPTLFVLRGFGLRHGRKLCGERVRVLRLLGARALGELACLSARHNGLHLADARHVPRARRRRACRARARVALGQHLPIALSALCLEGELQLRGPREQLVEHWPQLHALREQLLAPEDIQTQARARHRHNQSAHVTDVAHCARPNQAEQHDVRLLSLEAVNGVHSERRAVQRACVRGGAAAPRHDVLEKRLLPLVAGQHGDAACWVP